MSKLSFRGVMLSLSVLLSSVCLAGGKDRAVDLGAASAPYFKVGVALNMNMVNKPSAAELTAITGTFSSITDENALKPEHIQREKGKFTFDDADRYVAFGDKHGMKIIGHCLVWCQQTPAWMNRNSDGSPLSRKEAIENMRTHIRTLVGRYKGRVHGWDVVNEAWGGDGKLRQDSFWYKSIGEDYVELAFRFAHEADPKAELYYNDYNMSERGKCDAVVRMIKDFKSKGLRIDAVGFQTHVNLSWPNLGDYTKSMDDVIEAGCKVCVTEMDITVLPAAWNVTADITVKADYQEKYDPYRSGLPQAKSEELSRRYAEFFREYLMRAKYVDRVTLWGLNDSQSWLNDFPVRGRVDYPLFFDRQNQPKQVLKDLVKQVDAWTSRATE